MDHVGKTTLAVIVTAGAGLMALGAARTGVGAASAAAVSSMCDYKGGAATVKLDAEQKANAQIVIDVAAERRLPQRAAVIAIATTMQESHLHRHATGDGGTARGIFQQRSVMGWGTTAQTLDSRTSARTFFARLVHVKHWQTRPLTNVAQAIQRSATPGAYAKHERQAKLIVGAIVRQHCT